MNWSDRLHTAATVLRDMGELAPSGPWWVYQSPDDGLVVAHKEWPDDDDSDGSCIAYFAYPDDKPDRRTYEGALEAAKWMTLMDPLIAGPLADWLDSAANDAEQDALDLNADVLASAILSKKGLS